MKIWIDADAAPNDVKTIVFRASARLEIETALIANQRLSTPLNNPLVESVRVAGGPDVADQHIVDHASEGDLAITEPGFLVMIELIRDADVAFTNLEVLFHDYEPFPMHRSGGTYMRADPALAHELTWAGFDMVSLANNHTGDYGVEGMRLTRRYAEEAGLVTAGAGESLWEAREPRSRAARDRDPRRKADPL